jgi:glutaredoxin
MKYFKVIGRAECPFCIKAKALLESHKLQFEYCLVDNSEELLSYYKTNYKHNTVPIVILKEGEMNDQLIGGYTELVSLLKSGAPTDNIG